MAFVEDDATPFDLMQRVVLLLDLGLLLVGLALLGRAAPVRVVELGGDSLAVESKVSSEESAYDQEYTTH